MTPKPNESPTILHESQGLTIKKNAKNGFVVVSLLYFADPAKRNPSWEEEAKAGLSDAKWRKEYLIDYKALYGEKVFPEIITRKSEIVVTQPYPEVVENSVCWGGFDYGSTNPSSFHVYCIYEGVIYAVWELYEPCKNIPEFAQKMKDCPYWDQIRYIAADPSFMRLKSQQTKFGLVTVESIFSDEGIKKFTPGNTDEDLFTATVRKHWRPGIAPTLRFFDCCRNQIRELEGAVYVNISERQMQTNNRSEVMVDKDNHAIDDLKYFINSLPSDNHNTKKIFFPREVTKWLK